MFLDILCVTKAEPHARRFLNRMACVAAEVGANLVVAADGAEAGLRCQDWKTMDGWTGPNENVSTSIVPVHSSGYIESVLDEALAWCKSKYVLRLDDDEAAGTGMVAWLKEKRYFNAPHWKFSRAHLLTLATCLVDPQLWPDEQTRLSLRELSGGRTVIHSGSPFGGGSLAPCLIEHHKFLVKSLGEREVIADHYDRIQPGAGRMGGMAMFQVPELCPKQRREAREVELADLEAEVAR